jgi:outer membrane protein OmpA-like peptidoglycan-associated protein
VDAVRAYLLSRGLPNQVKQDAYGEAVTGSTHEAPKAEDRRVDVVVEVEK